MTIMELLADRWGGYEEYNRRLDESVALLIAGGWYVGPARIAGEMEHCLSIWGLDDQGRIRFKEDTGLCGRDAIALRPRPIESVGVTRTSKPEGLLRFRWNPDAGRDGARLFYGAFEPVED